MRDRTDASDDCPLVSVIIAARNEGAAIQGCLDALARQSYPTERLEVLLVDGMSEDDTVARARRAAPGCLRLTIIDNQRRTTPAGFNRGIALAGGEVVVVLGARARVHRDFVRASVEALARTGADAVGGAVRTLPGGDGLIARAVALAQRSPFGVGDAGYRYAATAREADTVNYGAYRRDVFERIGLFDESMQWVEDDELNYRLRAAGGHLWLDPAIMVEYRARPTLGALWRQRYRWGLHKLRVARRHPGQMRPRHAVPALFVLALTAGAALWPLGGRRRWPLLGLLGAYGGASLVATVRLGRRSRWPGETLLLPAAFATMHLAYGLGMLGGVARAILSRDRSGGAGDG